MENILYIGPYREFTGIGNAARKYIQALTLAKYNVSCRPLFNTFKPIWENEIHPFVLTAENNKLSKYDTIIQHCFPHQLCYNNYFSKNIGIVHLDSMNYGYNIREYINIMDEIWVGCNNIKNQLIKLNLDSAKIKIVPEFIDIDTIKEYILQNEPEENDDFVFYCIDDFTNKKNILTIITAYYLVKMEFPYAKLVIKTKHRTINNNAVGDIVNYHIDQIIKNYNFTSKKEEDKPLLIIGEIAYDNILYIHNNCDCYVNISSGESFGYSTLEAMVFNKQIIVNDNIGSKEIVNGTKYYPVDSVATNCLDADSQYHIYNTIDQQWYQPNLESLVLQMKKALMESYADKLERIDSQNNKIITYSINNIRNFI